MRDLASMTSVGVPFSCGESRSGPVTLGQRNVLMWIGEQTVERSDILFRFLDVPAGVTLADIADALGALLRRHESLRTLYRIDSAGESTQLVLGSGVLHVDVHEAEGDELESYLKERLSAKYFSVTEDLPVRVAVVTQEGVPFLIALACSHAVVDFAGVEIVSWHLALLLADPRDTAAVTGRQPVDQAEREQSAAGKRRAEAALRYWQTELGRRPQCQFAVPADTSVPARHREALLCSRASSLALTRIVARTGVSPSTILLAAAGTLLTLYTGNDSGMLVAICGNRFQPALREYVGTIAQDALVAFELGSASFDEVMRRSHVAAMNAYRYGQFDAARLWQIMDDVAEQRGTRFHRDCVVNDLVVHRNLAQVGAAPCGSDEPALALPETTFEFVPEVFVPVPFFFTVLTVHPEVRLGLYADTRYLPEGVMQTFLLGMEQLLLAAADGDVALADIPALTGLYPVRRGQEWARIDQCWIEIPAVRRMLQEVASGAPVHVAVEQRDGKAVLVAYVAAGEKTAREIHAACMAALPGRYSAMAPHEYVLCDQAPGDLTDIIAWERHVVVRGSGRKALF